MDSSRRGSNRRSLLLLVLWLIINVFIFEGELLGWRQEVAEAMRVNGTPRDFLAFYTAGLILQEGQPQALYDLELQETTQQSLLSSEAADRLHQQVRARVLPFVNPPFVAVLFQPLSYLALPQAYGLWLLTNAGLLFSLVAVLTLGMSAWSLRERLYAASAGLTFLPGYFAVWQGQISLLLALVTALAWLAFRSGKEQWAGFALALLLAKPQYALLVPVVLLWQRRWRAVVGFSVGALLLAVLSTALIGAEGLLEWLRLLADLPRLGSEYGHHAELQFTWSGLLSAASGRGFILREEAGRLSLLWLGLEAVTFLALALAWRTSAKTSEDVLAVQFSTLLIGMLLLSLHTNIQDLVLLSVAGYLTWDVARKTTRARSIAIAMLLGGHLLFLTLFLSRAIVPILPFPNLFVVPMLALWFLFLLLSKGKVASVADIRQIDQKLSVS